jgi:hypothetical protein
MPIRNVLRCRNSKPGETLVTDLPRKEIMDRR